MSWEAWLYLAGVIVTLVAFILHEGGPEDLQLRDAFGMAVVAVALAAIWPLTVLSLLSLELRWRLE